MGRVATLWAQMSEGLESAVLGIGWGILAVLLGGIFLALPALFLRMYLSEWRTLDAAEKVEALITIASIIAILVGGAWLILAPVSLLAFLILIGGGAVYSWAVFHYSAALIRGVCEEYRP
jgi:predicted branched-subunit amino acid permease